MPEPIPRVTAILTPMTMVCVLIMSLLWCGCGKPPMLVHQYLLEYPAPVVRATPLGESLKVEKFAVAQAFNTTAMVYRTGPYKAETYNYSRWRVNPGYQVTDFLIRDLRESHLFQAVLPADSATKARFALEGGVERIEEVDQGEVWQAALVLNITLLDTEQKDITKRVVFQKNYRAEEPLTEKTPDGLAQAMSRAMERLSAQIVTEVYQAAKKVSRKQ
jgi:cholesterol transport system auxiliary component